MNIYIYTIPGRTLDYIIKILQAEGNDGGDEDDKWDEWLENINWNQFGKKLRINVEPIAKNKGTNKVDTIIQDVDENIKIYI